MTDSTRAPGDVDEVRIVPTGEEHVGGFHAAVDVVARERRYIALVEAPPIAASLAFVRAVSARGGVHLVAVTADGTVVGWCDVHRGEREGFRHVGHLGMGLLPGYRGRGLGRRLMESAIAKAWEAGMERIELEVFASNARAFTLYEKLGFVTEGVKRRARKLDGRYDDLVLMALLREVRDDAG
jgi:RimJ/RimL family protein N-acetyltransferase